VDAVLRGEREYKMKFRLRHKGGHYISILSRGLVIRREKDSIVQSETLDLSREPGETSI
jgi:hypothetical protein